MCVCYLIRSTPTVSFILTLHDEPSQRLKSKPSLRFLHILFMKLTECLNLSDLKEKKILFLQGAFVALDLRRCETFLILLVNRFLLKHKILHLLPFHNTCLQDQSLHSYCLFFRWHRIAYSVQDKSVTLYLDCQRVETLDLQRGDNTVVSTDGVTVFGTRLLDEAVFEVRLTSIFS